MSSIKIRFTSTYFCYTIDGKNKDIINKENISEEIWIPYKEFITIDYIFSLCHEFGHCESYRSMSKSRIKTDLISCSLKRRKHYLNNIYLEEEIKAWDKCFDRIKPKYHNRLYEYAKTRFLSYFRGNYNYCRTKKYWLKRFDEFIEYRITI